MGLWNDGPVTVKAGEAITQYALVMIESGTAVDPPEVVETAGTQNADRAVVGIAMKAAADGEHFPVWPLSRGGLVKCIAAAANIARGDKLFSADDGKVTETTTSETFVGVAWTPSSADGDTITVLLGAQIYDAVDAT